MCRRRFILREVSASRSSKVKAVHLVKASLLSAFLCLPAAASAEENAKPKMLIQGRIEQIVQSNEIPEIILRKQKPKLDPRPLVAGAEVSSYPTYLIGRWGGNLRNVWSVTAPEIKTHLPQYRVGNVGTVVLHFDKVRDRVKLLPTVIFFPVEEVPVTQSVINTTKIEASSVAAIKKQTEETGILRGVPTLPLAKFQGEGLTGSKFVSQILHDSTRVLKPGVVEEDMVVGEWKEGEFYNYREFVSRFTWYGPTKVYAQILIANFGISRQAISKTLFEGWMDSNWKPAADSISNRLDLPWEEVVKRDGIE